MWPNSQFPADLVTFTEEILNEKLHFFVQQNENYAKKKNWGKEDAQRRVRQVTRKTCR